MYLIKKTDKEALQIVYLLQLEVCVQHRGRQRYGRIKDIVEVVRNEWIEQMTTEFDLEVFKRTSLWKLCV